LNLKYVLPRMVRHYLPRYFTHLLLRNKLIIKPGYDTSAPMEMVNRYQKALEQAGRSIQGQRIMDFGYGGSYALACGLLKAGASHVTLVDKFARPENQMNLKLFPEYEQYLVVQHGRVIPRPEAIEVTEADIHDLAKNARAQPFDVILSSSVYEHLDDVDGITHSLAALTKPSGCQVHFIDLRDHYFKYPFEMLTFSDELWKKRLNPGSNLNRYRFGNYQAIFERYFGEMHFTVLERDPVRFEQAHPRIAPRFLSGDADIDSITLLQVYAAAPKTLPEYSLLSTP
jgi:SAM-dependent methyltransferase